MSANQLKLTIFARDLSDNRRAANRLACVTHSRWQESSSATLDIN